MLQHHQRYDAEADRNQADEAELTIGELGQALERFTPHARREKGKQPFEDQQQREGDPQRFTHVGLASCSRYLPGSFEARPDPYCLKY